MNLIKTFKDRLSSLFGGRRPSVAIIDDMGFVRRGLAEALQSSHDVMEFCQIPETTEELSTFDILIVDGEGIGNKQYAHGVDFIKDYLPKHPKQKVIHYTGYCERAHKNALEAIGCKIVIKGYGSNQFADMIRKGEI